MRCENLQLDLPLYLDGMLSEDQHLSIDAHLPGCPLCRLKLDEYRKVKNDLRMIADPAMPSGLLQSVRGAVATEIGAPTINIGYAPKRTFREIFEYWLMPYSVGTLAALVMTVTLLTSLGSTRNATNEIAVHEKSETTMLIASSEAAKIRDELSLPDEFTRVALDGQMPGVNPSGALIALTKSIVRGEMEDEEVVVVADVFGNGLARINEIVDPPGNDRAMRELEKAFDTDPARAPFLPPKLEGNSKAVRIVLKIRRVDVVSATSSQ